MKSSGQKVWYFSPRAFIGPQAEIALGDEPLATNLCLPLEPFLRYGGPLRAVLTACGGPLGARFESPYAAKVMRQPELWAPVHRAELARWVRDFGPVRVGVPGASDLDLQRLARYFPGPAWVGSDNQLDLFYRPERSVAETVSIIADSWRELFPRFMAAVGAARDRLAQAFADSEAWLLTSNEWEPFAACGSVLAFLRSERTRATFGISSATFDLLRLEQATFACLFDPTEDLADGAADDAIHDRASTRPIAPTGVRSTAEANDQSGGSRRLRLNATVTILALESGIDGHGPCLLGLARTSAGRVSHLILGPSEAALLDELNEDGDRLGGELLAVAAAKAADFANASKRFDAPDNSVEMAISRLIQAKFVLTY